MFVCLKCDSSDITGYMKVLENELNIMLMVNHDFLKKDLEIAIAEKEKNIVISIPIDKIVLTKCEQGVRVKIVSSHPNNLKGTSNIIILFKSNQNILKMIDENIFKIYDSEKIKSIINFVDFKKIYLIKEENKNEFTNMILKDKVSVDIGELKNQDQSLDINNEDMLLKESSFYEPEVVCDLNLTKDLREKDVLERDILPEIDSFFKDKTTFLDIALKRAFINAILSFLNIYNSSSSLKNTFVFTKEDKKEIEFIKIKTKDLEDKNNIFLILIRNMINELNFANMATHIYLGIEKESKESIAILFALSKDIFTNVEDTIYESDIRVLETGLNDEFHYIIYECLI